VQQGLQADRGICLVLIGVRCRLFVIQYVIGDELCATDGCGM
jgi:hypothetical protein